MAIANYGELKTEVANWLKAKDLQSDANRIPNFIALAEDRIYGELDYTDLETTADLTIDAQTVALPSDFLEQRSHYIDVADPQQRVQYATPERLRDFDQGKQSSFPSFYTIEGPNLVFSPAPDSSYTGKWLYLARKPRLSADNDTNEILDKYQGLYLYGALIEGASYLGNAPRALEFAQFFGDAMEKANKQGRRARFPKGQKIQRSSVRISSGGRTKQ